MWSKRATWCLRGPVSMVPVLNDDLCPLCLLPKVLDRLTDCIAVLQEKVDGRKESGLGFDMFLKVWRGAALICSSSVIQCTMHFLWQITLSVCLHRMNTLIRSFQRQRRREKRSLGRKPRSRGWKRSSPIWWRRRSICCICWRSTFCTMSSWRGWSTSPRYCLCQAALCSDMTWKTHIPI